MLKAIAMWILRMLDVRVIYNDHEVCLVIQLGNTILIDRCFPVRSGEAHASLHMPKGVV